MHTLPPLGHAAREMFDVSDLVALMSGERVLPVLPSAIASAKRTLSANRAAVRVFAIVLRGENDQVDLVSIGRRGGWRREWRFGPVTRSARLV